jgi:hypothetical protein
MQNSTDPIIATLKVNSLSWSSMPSGQRLACLEALRDLICSECGSINFREIEGETVCTGCGTVRSLQHLENPTSEYNSQWNPVTNLAFGKNLGGTLGTRPRFGRKGLKEVLAKAPAGKEDIGLRVRFMNIMATQDEHPTIHRLLEWGSKLSHEFGMEGEDALLFADHFGKLLRRVGFSALLLLNPKTEALRTKKLAMATFVYVWQLMERDRGLRKEIEYETYFPGKRNLFRTVEPNKYKVDKQDWDFVNYEVNRKALWAEHQRLRRPLRSEGELMAAVKAAVNRLRLNGEMVVLSSEFLVDGQDTRLLTRKKRKPKYMKVTMARENLTEKQKQLLAVFDDAPPPVMSKSTVETNVCSFVARKSLGRGNLANAFKAIQGLEQSARSTGEVEVAEEQVRAVVDRLNLPGKSAKKQRQKSYDIYAFLVSVLKIKTGLTPDLFIQSVILKRLLEVYSDPIQVKGMPWGTRRRYGIVMRSLERLPLTLKSS